MKKEKEKPEEMKAPIKGTYHIGVRRFNVPKRLYKVPIYSTTSMEINQSKQGETIEEKIERIVANKEPIKDGAPLIYTERKEGIRASTNIRTDRWEIAVEATDKIAKSYKARREERGAETKKKDSGAESTEGTQQS